MMSVRRYICSRLWFWFKIAVAVEARRRARCILSEICRATMRAWSMRGGFILSFTSGSTL